MKAKLKAKDFLTAIKTVSAVHDFEKSKDDTQPVLLTMSESGLRVEAARMGAYVAKRCEAQLLREGSVGVSGSEVSVQKFTGDVTIDVAKDAVRMSDGRAKYNRNVDGSVAEDIEEQRNSIVGVKTVAKLPTTMLRSGAGFTTYKSETNDYVVTITIRDGYLEYCGHDHNGYARFVVHHDSIRAKKPVRFSLGNSLLHKVMKEVEGATVLVGISRDGSIVRFHTADFDCYHPTLDDPDSESAEAVLEAITKAKDSKCGCKFVVRKEELRRAVEAVKPVGKKDSDAEMRFVAKDDALRLQQHASDGAAVTKVETEKLKGDATIVLRPTYMDSFTSAAPKGTPLVVESWNNAFLHMYAKVDENTLIDYLAAMVALD